MQKEKGTAAGKPLKEKTSKAERRAMQEAQRAAKAAAKGKYSRIWLVSIHALFCSGKLYFVSSPLLLLNEKFEKKYGFW